MFKLMFSFNINFKFNLLKKANQSCIYFFLEIIEKFIIQLKNSIIYIIYLKSN